MVFFDLIMGVFCAPFYALLSQVSCPLPLKAMWVGFCAGCLLNAVILSLKDK